MRVSNDTEWAKLGFYNTHKAHGYDEFENFPLVENFQVLKMLSYSKNHTVVA